MQITEPQVVFVATPRSLLPAALLALAAALPSEDEGLAAEARQLVAEADETGRRSPDEPFPIEGDRMHKALIARLNAHAGPGLAFEIRADEQTLDNVYGYWRVST